MITLFTADGLVQIGGLMVPKRVSSSRVCSWLVLSHFILINKSDSNIGTKNTHCSIYIYIFIVILGFRRSNPRWRLHQDHTNLRKAITWIQLKAYVWVHSLILQLPMYVLSSQSIWQQFLQSFFLSFKQFF